MFEVRMGTCHKTNIKAPFIILHMYCLFEVPNCCFIMELCKIQTFIIVWLFLQKLPKTFPERKFFVQQPGRISSYFSFAQSNMKNLPFVINI